jgi:hypothetical protein
MPGFRKPLRITLLFVLSIEIMAIRLKSNKDVKGFNIKLEEKTHTIKISQLADDTTIFLSSKQNMYIAMNEIKILKITITLPVRAN